MSYRDRSLLVLVVMCAILALLLVGCAPARRSSPPPYVPLCERTLPGGWREVVPCDRVKP